jgi:hypothetical protein
MPGVAPRDQKVYAYSGDQGVTYAMVDPYQHYTGTLQLVDVSQPAPSSRHAHTRATPPPRPAVEVYQRLD